MAHGDGRRIVNFIFGFNVAYVVIPALAGAALSVLGIQKFLPAYLLLAVAGIWLEGHWLCSPFLSDKFALARQRSRRRHLPKPYSEPLKWAITICLLIMLLCGATEYWVYEEQLEFQRNDVFGKLEITARIPSGDQLWNTVFTVTNKGDFAVSDRNRIVCQVHTEYAKGMSRPLIHEVYFAQEPAGNWVVSGGDALMKDLPQRVRLAPDGDSQSDSCLSGYQGPPNIPGVEHPIICVDVSVIFVYSLEVQPDTPQQKTIRFFGSPGPSREYQWIQEPVDSKVDFCRQFRLR
jgi:hypothetical protein